MEIHKFQTNIEDFIMTVFVMQIGSDLLISVTGGDTPHIGTVTVTSKEHDYGNIRFPSHHDRYHKDDILSELIITHIKDYLPGNCVITSGVHVNNITRKQIEDSKVMAQILGLDILAWIKQTKFLDSKPVHSSYKSEEI